MSEKRDAKKGLIGMAGIYLTAGLGLPLVNVLGDFTPDQLMAARGALTALLVFCLIKGQIFKQLGLPVLWLSVGFTLVSIGLFRGIRAWGNNPTMMIMTAAPLVNIAVAWLRGKDLAWATVMSFFATVAGITLALQPWQGTTFNLTGLSWSVLAMLANAIFFEVVSVSSNTPALQRSFWQSLVLLGAGLALSRSDSWAAAADPKILLALIGFALIIGFFNFLANFTAFDNLRPDTSSVLVNGVTPATMLVSYFLLNETLTAVQFLGMVMALAGAAYLGYWVSQQQPIDKETTNAT
ncbi:DMT family transporter [Candidatus Falkowbacteria bacterium]|nr:DMT family transporter [Candidatus Falkowbacteria bacterium]